jgi:hypothetical protein
VLAVVEVVVLLDRLLLVRLAQEELEAVETEERIQLGMLAL